MLSSIGLRDDLVEAQRINDNALYLSKPILPDDVRKVVAAAVGHGPGGRQRGMAVRETEGTGRRAPGRGHESPWILLVDDNAFNQKVAVQKLTKLGHDVTVVAERVEASAMEIARFDLVFMDLHMRDMDGIEATRRIRKREDGTGRHTPVIAMTARAMKEDRDLCLASGMDGFVSKPIRDADLLRAIQAVPSPTHDSAWLERGDPHPRHPGPRNGSNESAAIKGCSTNW